MTVCTMDAAGLTVDDFRTWHARENIASNLTITDKNITGAVMDYDLGVEGSMVLYTHVKTPFIVHNRCCFAAVYNWDLPNGGFVTMSTSKG